MKKTAHYCGHRWTTDELRVLMVMWGEECSTADIAAKLSSTEYAILKQVQRLRQNGVPLKRRSHGHIADRSNRLWTQGEVEFLIRRRAERATGEQIAVELGRTVFAVQAMIYSLRREAVPIAMRGNGVRKLWDAEALKVVTIQRPDSKTIELDRRTILSA